MRVIVQRVAGARVDVGGETVAAIGHGLLLLCGVEVADSDADVRWMAAKLARLRIFSDAAGNMCRSLAEAGGEALAVSQFTLFASLRKGNRPSWSRAAGAEIARPLFERFVRQLECELGKPVPCGVFGADMQVQLVNDGPVSLFLDSKSPE